MPTRYVLLAASLFATAPAFAAEPPGVVHGVKVTTDKAPDCSSLKSIVESVTRGCRTNDERAIAVYNFLALSHYHQGYCTEPGGLGALREITSYGWSLCGGLHSVEAALWRELGWEWRYVGWSDPGHTTVEAFYDGRWHYIDAFLKFYAWVPDPKAPGGRTIAGVADLKADPTLITKGLVLDRDREVYYHAGDRFTADNWRAPAFLVCGDQPKDMLTGLRSSKEAGSPTGWNSINFGSPGYSTDVNLAPGTSLELRWVGEKGAHWWNGRKYVPGHSCGDKDYRNSPVIGPIFEPYRDKSGYRRGHANGTLRYAPDLNQAAVAGLTDTSNVKLTAGQLAPADPTKPASVTVALQSPYVMSRATGTADGATATLSTDGGKTFAPIDLADFSDAVGGKYAVLLKLTFTKPLRKLDLRVTVQCNNGALPYLSPGRNRVTVGVADAAELGANRLAVTYAYQLGSRSKSYAELAEAGAELGRGHGASWSDRVTVAQRIFTAKDLPATFTIDIPTPPGKHPVYPQMLFVRRELLAPSTAPQSLPDGATAAKPAKPEDLKSLPNPFTVGFGRGDAE
jgi:hypothetical protein